VKKNQKQLIVFSSNISLSEGYCVEAYIQLGEETTMAMIPPWVDEGKGIVEVEEAHYWLTWSYWWQ